MASSSSGPITIIGSGAQARPSPPLSPTLTVLTRPSSRHRGGWAQPIPAGRSPPLHTSPLSSFNPRPPALDDLAATSKQRRAAAITTLASLSPTTIRPKAGAAIGRLPKLSIDSPSRVGRAPPIASVPPRQVLEEPIPVDAPDLATCRLATYSTCREYAVRKVRMSILRSKVFSSKSPTSPASPSSFFASSANFFSPQTTTTSPTTTHSPPTPPTTNSNKNNNSTSTPMSPPIAPPTLVPMPPPTLERTFSQIQRSKVPAASVSLQFGRCKLIDTIVHVEILNLASEQESSRSKGYVLVFEFGCVVTWGLNDDEDAAVLRRFTEFEIDPTATIETDEFEARVSTRTGVLKKKSLEHVLEVERGKHEVFSRAVVCYCVAQSVKIAHFEKQVEDTIDKMEPLAIHIQKARFHGMSHIGVKKEIGRLFRLRTQLYQLDIDVVPGFIWEFDGYEKVFAEVCEYLKMGRRMEMLKARMDSLSDWFEALRDERMTYGRLVLFWLIILLIVFDALLMIGPAIGVMKPEGQ